MYIEGIEIRNLRTFDENGAEFDFVYPDRAFATSSNGAGKPGKALRRPKLPNMNLLLGDNGSGKTSVLRAIAASAFGPAAKDLLRDSSAVRYGRDMGVVMATLKLHSQDVKNEQTGQMNLTLHRRGERLEVSDSWIPAAASEPLGGDDYLQLWNPIFESSNESFLVVGYGATRRVERLDSYDAGARSKSRAIRDLRVWSLFEDSFSLIPLASWLPTLRRNSNRYHEVVELINQLIKPGHYGFVGDQDERGEYHFWHSDSDMPIPFQSLSDGYRAFIGWVGDLLHHLCLGCPKSKKLSEMRGIVLVDEIDLHLHPHWQMRVLPTISKCLPNLQFIVTSHSPLLASSLEWMNVTRLNVTKSNSTKARRLQLGIHGLDADQVLQSEYFGLTSTIAPDKQHELDRLTDLIRKGDKEAPLRLLRALGSGTEEGS